MSYERSLHREEEEKKIIIEEYDDGVKIISFVLFVPIEGGGEINKAKKYYVL